MYKGTGQMQPNVIGGQLICAFDQTAPYSQLGDKVRWLATSAKELLCSTTYLIMGSLYCQISALLQLVCCRNTQWQQLC
jgi:hypothetical protein